MMRRAVLSALTLVTAAAAFAPMGNRQTERVAATPEPVVETVPAAAPARRPPLRPARPKVEAPRSEVEAAPVASPAVMEAYLRAALDVPPEVTVDVAHTVRDGRSGIEIVLSPPAEAP